LIFQFPSVRGFFAASAVFLGPQCNSRKTTIEVLGASTPFRDRNLGEVSGSEPGGGSSSLSAGHAAIHPINE
jgi:hypothetical protein